MFDSLMDRLWMWLEDFLGNIGDVSDVDFGDDE